MSDPLISPTGEWVTLRRYINDRIRDLRDILEDADSAETRGAIKELRLLVKQVEPDKPLADPVDFFPRSQQTS